MPQPSKKHAAGPGSHLVVMGVSGSGKSTIAALLAAQLHCTFADGDDFHPRGNVVKMARGERLTDDDRGPWLAAMAEWLRNQDNAGRSTVLACSALKRSYREQLRAAAPQRVIFIHLAAANEVLHSRMSRRRGSHFMPPELLESQLATLEPLGVDERGITLDASATPEEVTAKIVERLASL